MVHLVLLRILLLINVNLHMQQKFWRLVVIAKTSPKANTLKGRQFRLLLDSFNPEFQAIKYASPVRAVLLPCGS